MCTNEFETLNLQVATHVFVVHFLKAPTTFSVKKRNVLISQTNMYEENLTQSKDIVQSFHHLL